MLKTHPSLAVNDQADARPTGAVRPPVAQPSVQVDPCSAYECETPNGHLYKALKEVEGLRGSPLGEEIAKVMREVNEGHLLFSEDNDPAYGPLMERLKAAPGVAGTERAQMIGDTLVAWFRDGVALGRGLIFPHAREIDDLVEDVRPWREASAPTENHLYLAVSGDDIPHAGFYVRLKPEVHQATMDALVPGIGGRRHLNAYVRREPDGTRIAGLAVTYDQIIGSRAMAILGAEGLLRMVADMDQSRASVSGSSNGLKKNGHTVGIGDDVLSVLLDCRFEGYVVKLPGQLERKLYLKVDEVLNLLGGKWNRGAGGHEFKVDPRQALQDAIETGAVEDTLKKFQFFPTPAEVAETIADLAQIQSGHAVLEPEAGAAGIVDALPDCRLEVCELNPEMAAALGAKGVKVVGDDFLAFHPGPVYDRIVANPPFTKGQDVAHVAHMLDCLAPGGRLVTVVPALFEHGRDRATQDLIARLRRETRFKIEPLPENAFRSSGVLVRTAILVADKPMVA